MKKNKIFILLPDGIGLRNFAYSNFYGIGIKKGFNVIFWNNTPFHLRDLGFEEIKIKNSKTHFLTDILKNAKIHIELNLNIKRSKDKVYDLYRFAFSYKTLKLIIKSYITKVLIITNSSNRGLAFISQWIKKRERSTLYYQESLETLKQENPSLVFCTSQRAMSAIAPLLAAQDLNIPTACFIFSWDNLPKATMIIETDYYFVWSQFMKKELLFYYPYIKESQIFITGTPQFEKHFDISNIDSKELFFKQNNMDLNKKYLCYSGDDSTTCPDDPQYLEDFAKAVIELNLEEDLYRILFRRCPVDFSSRFDKVLNEYKKIIVAVMPKWEQKGEVWNTILPTPDDVILQINTIAHTEMVVNLGSSMVFDYIAFNKPCCYINYNVQNRMINNWSVFKIYNFVHFRSMPTKKAVIWLNSPEEIALKIKMSLKNSSQNLIEAKGWFELINQHPPDSSSQRIWDSINSILG